MSGQKSIIAYCGLFCSECFSHTGKIADLARDLRKELRQERFDKTAESLSALSFFKVFNKYPECYEVLGAMVRLRCKKGCREGGGDPFCAIRRCCMKKGFEGCWQCDDFEDCRKMDFLKANHGDAHIKNLRKIKKKGKKEFLKGKKYWYSKIKP
jgi:hypothetical protein